ncbi:sec-independent protein translocase protein TatA [Deinococcus reticulitermitis]|uniref:Sec-independent protein translocase protein TatA n=1 Tax=Deinococcus reticulitermitis TaxID=856736 RepID=A0A1H6X7H6_9DEIO|nr:twin-arginine translocase TatA/TatE family subunit [Deinococcus reticulitermitis]SEJ24006.1 sec-independent protein translocase protein TatA [Deinococcus reticulitermitis]
MSFGPLEIILIVLAIALLFGAKKLPELMKGMGQGVREFRNEVKAPEQTQDGAVHTTTVSAQVPPVVDVPSRQLDPVTGTPVVQEAAAQPPERR